MLSVMLPYHHLPRGSQVYCRTLLRVMGRLPRRWRGMLSPKVPLERLWYRAQQPCRRRANREHRKRAALSPARSPSFPGRFRLSRRLADVARTAGGFDSDPVRRAEAGPPSVFFHDDCEAVANNRIDFHPLSVKSMLFERNQVSSTLGRSRRSTCGRRRHSRRPRRHIVSHNNHRAPFCELHRSGRRLLMPGLLWELLY